MSMSTLCAKRALKPRCICELARELTPDETEVFETLPLSEGVKQYRFARVGYVQMLQSQGLCMTPMCTAWTPSASCPPSCPTEDGRRDYLRQLRVRL